MTRSLQDFGMDAATEAALISYFANPADPDDSEMAKWSRIHRVFNDEWEYWVGELESELRSFYEFGLLTWALTSEAALKEYEARVPPVEPVRNYAPGNVGSKPWVKQLDREKARPTAHAWFKDLYTRESNGISASDERQVLDQIRQELVPELRKLVERFNKRLTYVQLKLQREEKALLDTARRERLRPSPSAVTAGAQSSKRTHRKYGESEPEVEVVYKRSPRKDD